MKSDEKKARRQFTAEYQDPAVKRVLLGHKVLAVAKELGISERLLHTWVTRHRLSEGRGAVPVEQAAEIARLKRMLAQKDEEAAILKKRWRTLRGTPGKVRLHASPRGGVFDLGDVPRAERHPERLLRVEAAG